MNKNFSMARVLVLLGLVLSLVAMQCLYKTFFFGATEFYFVRHGQTDYNIGLIKKDLNVPLDLVGRQQAEMVKSYVKNHLHIKTICYSPLLRAKQTKDIINADLGLPEVEIPKLAEGAGGFWFELYRAKNKPVKVSKSLQNFLDRVTIGLHEALQQPAPVLIVAHGGVYIALCRILNISTNGLPIANCSLMHFYKKDGHWHVKQLFDVKVAKLLNKTSEQNWRKKFILV